jgi:hypothetical protein
MIISASTNSTTTWHNGETVVLPANTIVTLDLTMKCTVSDVTALQNWIKNRIANQAQP